MSQLWNKMWKKPSQHAKSDFWQKQKRADQQSTFLYGFILVLFQHSSSMQHVPLFSPAPSRSLINALLLPVCTLYISFDQCVCHISMYLNIPLCSQLKLPACQRHRSCGASPRYGRRRSGLVRIIIANEHGPALPRMRGRTKSLAMHVLSGPSTACTLVHEWSCWFNAEASLPLWDVVP